TVHQDQRFTSTLRDVSKRGRRLAGADTERVLTLYREAAEDRGSQLTCREEEVLRGIGRGLTNFEIAGALAISEVTAQGHAERICGRRGLRAGAAAIVYAFAHGIVLPGVQVTTQRQAPPALATSAPALRVSVLGPLRAWHGDRQLDLGPVRQQALLAALALRP